MFFFRRKARKAQDEDAAELRRHYRATPPRSASFSLFVKLPSGEVLPGEVVDLSIQGASGRYHLARDPAIKIGDVVELTIAALNQREAICTPARVVSSVQADDAHLRYGFEFINLGNLYSQLDSYYARFFNRRRHQRVLPELGRKIPITLSWEGQHLEATIQDLSSSGVGLALTRQDHIRLSDVDRLGLRFRLPGTLVDIETEADVRQRSEVANKVVVGLEFDCQAPGTLEIHRDQIEAYIARRGKEIAAWEEAWT